MQILKNRFLGPHMSSWCHLHFMYVRYKTNNNFKFLSFSLNSFCLKTAPSPAPDPVHVP